MIRPALLSLLLLAAPGSVVSNPVTDGPAYSMAGDLKLPEYREWVFLTAGVDMSYSSTAAPEHSVFDNVFVNPGAYRAFRQTGTWPDKTVLVLEIRNAEGAASINKRGHTQSASLANVEIHVKDEAKGGWTFYGFSGGVTEGKAFPRAASCYSCHQEHGVVDTTFVQFYPTMLPIAKQHGTIRPELLKELEPPAAAESK